MYSFYRSSPVQPGFILPACLPRISQRELRSRVLPTTNVLCCGDLVHFPRHTGHLAASLQSLAFFKAPRTPSPGYRVSHNQLFLSGHPARKSICHRVGALSACSVCDVVVLMAWRGEPLSLVARSSGSGHLRVLFAALPCSSRYRQHTWPGCLPVLNGLLNCVAHGLYILLQNRSCAESRFSMVKTANFVLSPYAGVRGFAFYLGSLDQVPFDKTIPGQQFSSWYNARFFIYSNRTTSLSVLARRSDFMGLQ